MSENIIVTEGSEEVMVDEVKNEVSAVESVMRVIDQPGYFPNLAASANFISTVVGAVGDDLSHGNIVKQAYMAAQQPEFIELIPKSCKFMWSDGTIHNSPEKTK